MPKSLQEMSNEELWELFPIIISEHDPEWKNRYLAEKVLIEKKIGDDITRINHIGSTAIEGLLSKPTIDILVEIRVKADTDKLIKAMVESGYIFSPQPENPAPHMMFLKGYTTEGFRRQVFHVHVRYSGDWDELYFRDFLAVHPDTTQEYGKLKLKLKECFEHDRDGYTEAKTVFVKKYSELARREFGARYKPQL